MKINGVKFIPSSLVTCLIQEFEVRIVELAFTGLSIRVPKELEKIDQITLHFLHPEQNSYHSLVLREFQIEKEERAFYDVYTIFTGEKNYVAYVKQTIKEYGDYIDLKLSGDDGYLSACMVNYPEKKDLECYATLEEQKRDWFHAMPVRSEKQYRLKAYELAFGADNPKRYQDYLSMSMAEYQEKLLKENNLLYHPLLYKEVQRLYIGNQFCHNLLPSKDMRLLIMNKAREENLEITLVFTYLRDEFVEKMEGELQSILTWCQYHQQSIEVVVNDWGMVKMLQSMQAGIEKPWIQLNLGVLLNKRRKDPRYRYKRSIRENVDNLSKNNVNSESFQKYLREKCNITRFEFEVCQTLKQLDTEESVEIAFCKPDSKYSLHLPYYQTNTSQYCALYAKCTTGDRGNQKLAKNCPHYCEEKVFMYPKHLNMLGRYNSLFGFEDSLLREPEKINRYISNGMDRLVCTLL